MRFLVATDRSDHSLRAFPHAAALAKVANAGLVLVQVFNPRLDASKELDTSLSRASERVAGRWKEELEQLARARGLDAEVRVAIQGQRERTDDAIVRIGQEEGAALIAMDTRGSGRIRHALVGSVATGVVNKSPLPVMLTRAGMAEPVAGGRYRILVTNDGSPAALDVIREMQAMLAEVRPEVVLLRGHEVVDAGTLFAELDAVAREFPEGVDVTPRLESLGGQKKAADLIVEVAREVGANAIAMSTHGHSARRHLFAGSVTMDVLGSSPVPVIVGRAG
ncbi:MAG: universal stress protein [Dehalococcoidia bacterium]